MYVYTNIILLSSTHEVAEVFFFSFFFTYCTVPIFDLEFFSLSSPQRKFTTKSDVWSFGVTLWEILNLARHRPYEGLSDVEVLENISHLHADDGEFIYLPTPQTTKDILDLMNECWKRSPTERPSFTEIHLFLQRKNLGYSPPGSWGDKLLGSSDLLVWISESYIKAVVLRRTPAKRLWLILISCVSLLLIRVRFSIPTFRSWQFPIGSYWNV